MRKREINVNSHKVEISELTTEIFGLTFKPQMINYNNYEDGAPFTIHCSSEVSTRDYNLVSEITKDYMTHGVMEIGVSRNGDGSFTNAMLNNKPDNIKYLGVDIEDKAYLNNTQKNIFTIKENSFNQVAIRSYLKNIGLEKISILFIDGHHSVESCLNDWLYADLLSDNGIIILHDTNYHPGPRVILESIDSSIFRVDRHFVDEDDYGVTIAYKL